MAITVFQNCAPPNPEAGVPRINRYTGFPTDLGSNAPTTPSSSGTTTPPTQTLPTGTGVPTLPGSGANGGTPTIPGGATIPGGVPPANMAVAQALATVRCEPDAVIRALKTLPAGTMIGNQSAVQVANDIDEACEAIWWLEDDILGDVINQCNATGSIPVPNCSCQQLFTQCL